MLCPRSPLPGSQRSAVTRDLSSQLSVHSLAAALCGAATAGRGTGLGGMTCSTWAPLLPEQSPSPLVPALCVSAGCMHPVLAGPALGARLPRAGAHGRCYSAFAIVVSGGAVCRPPFRSSQTQKRPGDVYELLTVGAVSMSPARLRMVFPVCHSRCFSPSDSFWGRKVRVRKSLPLQCYMSRFSPRSASFMISLVHLGI